MIHKLHESHICAFGEKSACTVCAQECSYVLYGILKRDLLLQKSIVIDVLG